MLAAPANAADVTPQRLENADSEPQNWLMGFQNYSSHRFSRLDEINKDNVTDLRVVYTLPISTGLRGRNDVQLENYGLVDDGFMYLDDAGGIFYKIDLTDPTQATTVWTADAALPRDIRARSRGITMLGNAIFHNLADGRVVAIDRDSGEFLWDVQIARVQHPNAQTDVGTMAETFTAAPIAVGENIIVANSGGDAGSRGWVASVDAATGEEGWRFYVIPGPGEQGHETWKDDNGAWMTGGGGMWTTGSIDVEQGLTIWGTGQPQPMHDPEFRPGDNLFTNSAIALSLEDGTLEWYFQYTANENWDYDEQGVHMLIDAPLNGEPRQMVTHFGRNGFYYQLDRTTGEFLTASQYVEKVNWTAGIDPKTGHPVEYNPNIDVQTYIPETRTLRGDRNDIPACPHRLGGVRWQPPAYNPNTMVAYSGGLDGCFTYWIEPVTALPGGGIDRSGPGGSTGIKDQRNSEMRGLLASVDVTTGQLKASLGQEYYNLSGVLATAGGLIFSGTLDGAITAHDEETLAEVWRFETGISMKAAPFTYAVDGKQYVAIIAGGNAPDATVFPELATMAPGAALYVFSL
jgi:alcohol dehydrogenase (cytochrome c)